MALWYAAVSPAPAGREAQSRAARELLRYACRREFGRELPEIAVTGEGKPFFPAEPGRYLSLSHSGEHLLCALASVPVGCDIQLRREVNPSVIARLMSEREREDFDFFELWTLRESLFKMRGCGSLRNARFRIEGGAVVPPLPGTSCFLYRDIPGCACAVCLLGEQPLPELRRVDNLCLK